MSLREMEWRTTRIKHKHKISAGLKLKLFNVSYAYQAGIYLIYIIFNLKKNL